MRAVLHGGPVDQRTMDDVPDGTWNIKIPTGDSRRYAHYERIGNGVDTKGPYLRFDFTAVYDADGRPMTAW